MANHLENYLRTQRKQSGLTQREVAFLLGGKNGNQVSRYERRRWLPPLKTALAFEAIFTVPVAELFAGVHQTIAEDVAKRRAELRAILVARMATTRRAAVVHHKLRWLGEDGTASAPDHASKTA